VAHDPASRTPQPPSDPTLVVLSQHWARLTDDERQLASLALDAVNDGQLADARAWQRYTDAVLDLLPALDAGTLTPTELHRRALDATR